MYVLYAKQSVWVSLWAEKKKEMHYVICCLAGSRRWKSAPHMLEKQNKITLEALGIRLALKRRLFSVPPRVAERRRWVPYFLIRLSVIIWRVGRLPSWRMACMKSGSRGKARPPLPPKLSRFSTARLLTFHRPNSLGTHTIEMYCI